MKVFLENHNGILDLVEDQLSDSKELTDNPHEADIFLLWQDVRGVWRDIAKLAKHQIKKPVVVMQHGRGATRDYGEPNKFPLVADKIMVWGNTDRERLLSYGISSDKIVVTGCPLLQRLLPKNKEREGKNVLFVPVIAQKEEPENLLVHAVLKIWEQEQLIKTIYSQFGNLKKAWAWENNLLREVTLPDGTKEKRLWKKEVRHSLPRWLTYAGGLVNVKLSGIHDQAQYQSPLISSNQNDPNLIDELASLLTNIDAMVCLEEGTMQLMAHALDIPVVVADIFQYKNYGGCKDYDRVEKIHTKAAYWTTDINKVPNLLNQALKNPMELARQRKIVLENEAIREKSGEDVTAYIIESLRSIADREPVNA